MNLFESQINQLNISPTAKQTVIELRKICLESEADGMPTITPGVSTDNSREALAAIRDTVRKAAGEIGNDYYKSGESIVPAYLAKINEYRKGIEQKYGPKYGEALVAEAKKYAQRMSLQ